MGAYQATFATTISLTVEVDAEDEDTAADLAWEDAEEYLRTVLGDHRTVRAEATLDGIGADAVTALPDPTTALRAGLAEWGVEG